MSISKFVEQHASPNHVTIIRGGRHGRFIITQPMDGTYAWTPTETRETAIGFARNVSKWINLPVLDKTVDPPAVLDGHQPADVGGAA